MSLLKPWLYYLIEPDGRVRQIVNKIVTSLNKKTPLQNVPVGWDSVLIKWARNVDRHGQVRNYSLPMGFVRDGAKILRNDMYTFNIDRELYLLIQRLTNVIDSTTYSERYNFFYKGQLDFSTFEDDPGGSVVNINIMEGGISKLVKANEDTQFLIPFDADAVNVKMDGIALEKIGNFEVLDGFEIGNADFGGFFSMPFSFINSDGNAYGLAFQTQELQQIDGTVTYAEKLQSINWAAEAGPTNGATVNAHIKGNIIYRCTVQDAANGLKVRFLRSNQPLVNQNDYILFEDTPLVAGQLYTHPVDITIPLLPGERLYLEGFLGFTGTGTNIEFQEGSKLTIDFSFKKSTTFIKAMSPYNVYRKLCELLGIDDSNVISTLLQASTYYLTSGDAIRGLPNSGIKTSFNDFFKAFDIYLFAGMDIKRTIEIETRDKYYDETDPILLGQVRDFKCTPATDRIFSSIVIGHAEQDIDDVNGKYDFNGQHTYITPVKSGGGKKLEMISPYKAGPFEIEVIRINLEGKTSTDATQDNQVFVLDLNTVAGNTITATVSFSHSLNAFTITSAEGLVAGQKIRISGSVSNNGEYIIQSIGSIIIAQIVVLDGLITDESSVPIIITIVQGQIYSLDRSVFPTSIVPPGTVDSNGNPVTGPDLTTIFNVRLRPSALFELHYRWIRSWLYNYEPGIIKFDHANRNAYLVVDGLTDGRDVVIANMGQRIFLPFYFEFGTVVPIDLVETLDASPNKAFTPNWEGDNYTGFLIDAGIAPNSRQPQIYKLLCAADTDITKLIA